MNRCFKMICILLAAVAIANIALLPVSAVELNIPTDEDWISVAGASIPEETDPVQTESVEMETTESTSPETVPAETVPEQTLSAEAIPEETVLAETEPEVLPEEDVAEEPEEERVEYDAVPLFYQNDYPDTMYGHGTVATSGCSITSLAMVATYLTGHEYTPDELARYFGGKADNYINRLEYGSKMLKLPWEKAENWHVARKALKEGKIVIALMNYKSIFTDSQHFVVITGVNGEGRFMVNDPYKPNYDKWDLKYGFEHGFEDLQISRGYSGAWIYDPDAMPEDPYIYSLPEYNGEPRYPDVLLTKAERDLLAKMVWVEARGESFEGQQAVAEVVLNRLVSGDFQDTIRGIVYANGQFRSTQFLDDADPNQTQYDAVDYALKGPYVLDEGVVYFAQFPVNENVWGRIGGHVFCYDW